MDGREGVAAEPDPAGGSAHPVVASFDRDYAVSRWSVLNILWGLPHLAIAWVLAWLSWLVALVSVVPMVITGRLPDALLGIQAMSLRYQWRAYTYCHFLRTEYPPFDFDTSAIDHTSDPSKLSVTRSPSYPPLALLPVPGIVGRVLRLLFVVYLGGPVVQLVFFAFLMSLVFVTPVGFVAVVVTGAWPRRLGDYVLGVYRFGLRAAAYSQLVVDAPAPLILGP